MVPFSNAQTHPDVETDFGICSPNQTRKVHCTQQQKSQQSIDSRVESTTSAINAISRRLNSGFDLSGLATMLRSHLNHNHVLPEWCALHHRVHLRRASSAWTPLNIRSTFALIHVNPHLFNSVTRSCHCHYFLLLIDSGCSEEAHVCLKKRSVHYAIFILLLVSTYHELHTNNYLTHHQYQ